MTEVSKETEIEFNIKYAGMCGKSGIRNILGGNGDSDDSDGEDLEAYDGFAEESGVTNVERTAAV